MAQNDQQQYPDEDTFLTALESKLRFPFSSVELAKIISPHTTPLIPKVLHRAEKSTQLRILTGLLGCNTDDKGLKEIVEVAQTSPDYEEWVRVVAGIVQATLGDGTYGAEAQTTLDTSCKEIIKRVRETERASAIQDEGAEHLLGQSDIHEALCVPFRACLDANTNHDVPNEHFKVNLNADILHIDARLAREKAKEDKAHAKISAAVSQKAAATPAARNQPVMPGMGRKVAARAAPKKSSMFMPTQKKAKPVQAAKKTLLHKRKPGAAQALLNKGRQRGANAKLKLVDVAAVKDGSAGKQSLIPDKGRKGATLKRKAEIGSATGEKRTKTEHPMPPSPSRQQDWRKMLELRSNILTDQDRERIRQFFEEHSNPTPDEESYRCKLHEVRTPQEKTTYYIELDYKTFKSKQFSKIKKYV